MAAAAVCCLLCCSLRRGGQSGRSGRSSFGAGGRGPSQRTVAADGLVCLAAAFALAFVWFARALPAVWALVHGPLITPLAHSPFVDPRRIAQIPEASAAPFVLVSAASHTGAVAVGLAMGDRTRRLPSRHRFTECLCTALVCFGALTVALRAGFTARLPLVHPFALLFFDSDATLPFALVGGASVTAWLSLAMAIQHHPLGRRLLHRRMASGVVLLAATSYLLDMLSHSAIYSGSLIIAVALPAIAAGGAAARLTASGG